MRYRNLRGLLPRRGAIPDGIQQPHGALVGLHAFLHQLQEVRVLASPQAVDRVLIRVIVRVALRNLNVPAGQQGGHALVAAAAVQVVEVILFGVGLSALGLQESAEHPCPRLAVELCGRGDHTVEVEKYGVKIKERSGGRGAKGGDGQSRAPSGAPW